MSVIQFPSQGKAPEIPKPRTHAPMTPFTLAINDGLNEEGHQGRLWSCFLYLADGLTRERQMEIIRWGLEQYKFPCAPEPGKLKLLKP